MADCAAYTVGWICAVSTERVAAIALLDEEHEQADFVSPNDNNVYTLGRMWKHNVVIAALADAEYGTDAAASVARDMLHSFPNVRIGLMVGIAGGAPSPRHDIRLGDVVVSSPRDGHGGVFQYDFGKTVQARRFQDMRFLNQPPTLLRAAVSELRSRYEIDGHDFGETIEDALKKRPRLRKKYSRPPADRDRLYQSNSIHHAAADAEGVCSSCSDVGAVVPRHPRSEDEDDPVVHYGLIASGNQLMKDAMVRDRLISEKDVLCFEMEAAGLMNHFPCLVIRGICDYSDSHKNDDWQGYAAMTAAAYAKDVLRKISLNRMESQRPLVESLLEFMKDARDDIDDLVATQRSEREDKILDWLAPSDYEQQHGDYFSRRQEGTGQWLLESCQFNEWLMGHDRTLFCPGIPGAGKTILASMVVDYLLSESSDDGQIGLGYIYFNYKRQDEQTVSHLLASLVRQLACSQARFPTQVQILYDKYKSRGTRPTDGELSTILSASITTFSRVFIIIDALDECHRDTLAKLLPVLLDLQEEIEFSIFATSRFIPAIEEYFCGESVLEIRATGSDVERLVQAHMSQLPSCVQADQILQEAISTEISQAVDGMFLLAQIYIQLLEDKLTPNDVRQTLQHLKEKNEGSRGAQKVQVLDSAYDQAVERVNGQRDGMRTLARRVLLWTTFSKRPLTTTELQYALGVKYGTSTFDSGDMVGIQDMAYVCAGLITVDIQSNIIRLVHYTAQEYFERVLLEWFGDPQINITTACATYLAYTEFGGGPCVGFEAFQSRLHLNPFYEYACHYWGHHARDCRSLAPGVVEFLEDPAKLEAAWQTLLMRPVPPSAIYSRGGQYPRGMTGLHMAAFFGVVQAVEALLDRGAGVAPINTYGETPLWTSIQSGHLDVACLLLDKGSHTNISEKLHGETPLILAIRNQNRAMVELLLDYGASLASGAQRSTTTAMYWAFQKGNEDVLKQILKSDHGREAFEAEKDAALFYASIHGSDSVAQMLLTAGAATEYRDGHGRTPLISATLEGHESTVRLLLDNGAQPDATDGANRTALLSAVSLGNEGIVKLLLESGADMEARDDSGRDAFSVAARLGRQAVISLLLESEQSRVDDT